MRWGLLVLALSLGPALRAEEDPSAAPIRAILLETEDVGLRKVYDGIRRGLELARLPRVELETIQDTEAAFVAYAKKVAADPPPLLFAIGRRAGQRVVEVGIRARRVFVDTCVAAGDRELPAPLRPSSVAAVVRGRTPASRWGEVVRSLFPNAPRPRVALSWDGPSLPEAGADALRAFAAAARVDVTAGAGAVAGSDGSPEPDPLARLDLRLGVGEVRERPTGLYLSDDPKQWGRGAVVVLVPDHALLGRTAAEAGRRLLQETPMDTIEVRVAVTEVRVDLDAARAVGFEPPIGFVASADVVRGPKR